MEDLRGPRRQPGQSDQAGDPDQGESDEGLQVMDPPEPLVVPVDQLWQENDERVLARRAQAENADLAVHVHVAELIKVRGYGLVFSFMGLHMGTYKQARKLDGFTFGGIRAHWWAKKFWTYTIWQSRAAMEEHTAGRLHANMVSRLPELAAPGSCYVEWESNGNPDWPEALRRLQNPTRYYVDPFAR